MYRQENFNTATFDGVGAYEIPVMNGVDHIPEVNNWYGFREKKDVPVKSGLHFFIDDFRFENVWTRPDKYIDMLRKYEVVLSPDFSMYTDMPKALQIYNHYRKQWLSAYWQMLDIPVIPTIAWSNEESYSFCFDGVPTNSVVAVSSVGTQKNKESKRLFALGYDAMMERLSPVKVLYFGNPHKESSEIVLAGRKFTDKFSRSVEDGR